MAEDIIDTAVNHIPVPKPYPVKPCSLAAKFYKKQIEQSQPEGMQHMVVCVDGVYCSNLGPKQFRSDKKVQWKETVEKYWPESIIVDGEGRQEAYHKFKRVGTFYDKYEFGTCLLRVQLGVGLSDGLVNVLSLTGILNDCLFASRVAPISITLDADGFVVIKLEDKLTAVNMGIDLKSNKRTCVVFKGQTKNNIYLKVTPAL